MGPFCSPTLKSASCLWARKEEENSGSACRTLKHQQTPGNSSSYLMLYQPSLWSSCQTSAPLTCNKVPPTAALCSEAFPESSVSSRLCHTAFGSDYYLQLSHPAPLLPAMCFYRFYRSVHKPYSFE